MSSLPHFSVSQLAFGSRRVRSADTRIEALSPATAAIIKDIKANRLPPDPRSRYAYAAMKSCDQIAVPLVKIGDGANSITVTADGGSAPRRFLSRKPNIVSVQPESSGDFLLVIVTRSYYRTLFGLNPKATVLLRQVDLSPEREWTDDERERWITVNRWAARITHGINCGGAPARGRMRFGETA